MRLVRTYLALLLFLVWTPLSAIAEDISLQHFVRNGLTSEFEVLAGARIGRLV